MAALDEVGNALEDVGNLTHHPQPLLHEGEQLSVLLRCGTLLNPVKDQFKGTVQRELRGVKIGITIEDAVVDQEILI
jgi:hypothetical protein